MSLKKWTKSECLKAIKKYEFKTDFIKNSPGAFGYAFRKGKLNKICKHMN
jgi:hypothetical protein